MIVYNTITKPMLLYLPIIILAGCFTQGMHPKFVLVHIDYCYGLDFKAR